MHFLRDLPIFCLATISLLPGGASAIELIDLSFDTELTFQKSIVAGDPAGAPPDTPAVRIDPNDLSSVFAGVVSFNARSGGSSFICSGVAISPYHILTAAHCVDTDDDGAADISFGTASDSHVHFLISGDATHTQRNITAIDVHPEWTGFNNPIGVANDDFAILTLDSPIPAGVPFYSYVTTEPTVVEDLTLVGYGTTGDGVSGYTSGSASFSNKRVGQNSFDAVDVDDEGSGAFELFFYDFDGPTGDGTFGGATLGNDIETIIGGGDSGGPAFRVTGSGTSPSDYEIIGLNTFTLGSSLAPGTFGNLAGGVLLTAPTTISWINSVLGVPEPSTYVLFSLLLLPISLKRRSRKHQLAEVE